MRVAIAIFTIFILFVGRGPHENRTSKGLHLWGDYEIYAFATPWGPVYFGDSEKDPFIRAHELCHIRRMEKIGAAKFMYRYLTDRSWACQEERICGWHGPHPRCTSESASTSANMIRFD